MKREVFSDAQILRTRFYSCSEDKGKRLMLPETDFRHHGDFLYRVSKNDSDSSFRRKKAKKSR